MTIHNLGRIPIKYTNARTTVNYDAHTGLITMYHETTGAGSDTSIVIRHIKEADYEEYINSLTDTLGELKAFKLLSSFTDRDKKDPPEYDPSKCVPF